MKLSVLVFAILCIKAFAYVDSQLKQKDIMETDYAEALAENRFGRAILRMAQLQSMSQQVEFGKLFNAIDELEETIKESKDQESAQFDRDYQQYLSDIDFFRNQVTQFKNEVAQHEVDLADLQDTRQSYEHTRDTKRGELEETQKLNKQLERQAAEDEKIFNQQTREYDQAVEVIDQAIQLVEQVRSGSFVETEKLKGASDSMKESLGAMSHQRVFYQPLVEALVDISQQKFADQQLVTKVLKLLRDLRTQLNASRVSLANAYNSQNDSNQQTLKQYAQKIENLVKITLPQLQSDIETKNGEISSKGTMLSDAQNNLNQAQGNLDATEAAWVQRQADNKKLNDQYNNEMNQISVVRSTLERAGIRRQ